MDLWGFTLTGHSVHPFLNTPSSSTAQANPVQASGELSAPTQSTTSAASTTTNLTSRTSRTPFDRSQFYSSSRAGISTTVARHRERERDRERNLQVQTTSVMSRTTNSNRPTHIPLPTTPYIPRSPTGSPLPTPASPTSPRSSFLPSFMRTRSRAATLTTRAVGATSPSAEMPNPLVGSNIRNGVNGARDLSLGRGEVVRDGGSVTRSISTPVTLPNPPGQSIGLFKPYHTIHVLIARYPADTT